MKILAAFLCLTVIATTATAELPAIFTGRDLSGWKAPENNIWWKVDSGVLHVQSGPDKKGQTLWTEKEYKNFIMQFDFQYGKGTVDTGIYVRNSKEQIQIGMSGSLKRDLTASPYIAGKGYPVEAAPGFAKLSTDQLKPGKSPGIEKIIKKDDWNSMTIIAIGKNYTVYLNGQYVMSYDSESAPAKGPVGIQLHGNRDMSCAYRNIRLQELH
ncbi:MAG: DUF1080 domain-containing protein [Planctomycetota bacterium]